MFKKLFGSGSAAKQQAPQIDPHETMNKLSLQIENVEKRTKKIEADMKRLMSEALEKKKAKDTRGKYFVLALAWRVDRPNTESKLGYRCSIRIEEEEDAGEGGREVGWPDDPTWAVEAYDRE